MAIRLDARKATNNGSPLGSIPLTAHQGERLTVRPDPAQAVANSNVEPGTSRGSLVKGGVFLFAAALGVAIGGLAILGAWRWRDERNYQAWRRGRPWAGYPAARAIQSGSVEGATSMTNPAQVTHRVRAFGIAIPLMFAVLVALIGGCASAPAGPIGGTSGPISWRFENVTVSEDPVSGRLKWQYIVKVRDLSGSGIHFTNLYYTVGGQRMTPRADTTSVNLRLDPAAEVEFPCSQVVYFGASGGTHPYAVRYKRVYSGVDGKGNPVQAAVEYELDRYMPRKQPRLLEFARLTADSAGNATLYCESIPKETQLFDPDRNDSVHLLIAIDNVQRSVPVRTRWLSPDGEEVKVIDGSIRANSFPASTSFVHVTHTLATSVMKTRPGIWKVELFLDGNQVETHTFEVRMGGVPPVPRRL